MLNIEKLDHVGVRIADKAISIRFYETLGFDLISDAGFDEGRPIFMRHAASGVVLNLPGPSNTGGGSNILMDVDEKYPGYTHYALKVCSLDETRAFLDRAGITITGSIAFGDFAAIFIRDPDRNVIEFNEYQEDLSTRKDSGDYTNHP